MNTELYPPSEFVRDLDDCRTARLPPNALTSAQALFSRRYPDSGTFSYRYNRFVCIMSAASEGLPASLRERISRKDILGHHTIPAELLLALHEWFCGLPEDVMRTMPAPDWSQVEAIHDRLISESISCGAAQ